MSDKLPTTRRGIYLTNLQWADAKAAGDGIYSAGVRRRMDEWEALSECNELLAARLGDQIKLRKKVEALEAEKVERERDIERYIDANGELALDVDNLTVERDTLKRECDEEQTKIDRLRAERDRLSVLLLESEGSCAGDKVVNGELVLQVDNLRDALTQVSNEERAKRDKVQAKCDEASLALARRVLEVQELRAAPAQSPRMVFALGFLAACMMGAAALAVLEGIDKGWWGWTF